MTTIESAVYKPLEQDEQPGMPTFRVKGVYDGAPFEGELSVEVDGRDIEWKGTPDPDGPDWNSGMCAAIIEELWSLPAWEDARSEHGEYMG